MLAYGQIKDEKLRQRLIEREEQQRSRDLARAEKDRAKAREREERERLKDEARRSYRHPIDDLKASTPFCLPPPPDLPPSKGRGEGSFYSVPLFKFGPLKSSYVTCCEFHCLDCRKNLLSPPWWGRGTFKTMDIPKGGGRICAVQCHASCLS